MSYSSYTPSTCSMMSLKVDYTKTSVTPAQACTAWDNLLPFLQDSGEVDENTRFKKGFFKTKTPDLDDAQCLKGCYSKTGDCNFPVGTNRYPSMGPTFSDLIAYIRTVSTVYWAVQGACPANHGPSMGKAYQFASLLYLENAKNPYNSIKFAVDTFCENTVDPLNVSCTSQLNANSCWCGIFASGTETISGETIYTANAPYIPGCDCIDGNGVISLGMLNHANNMLAQNGLYIPYLQLTELPQFDPCDKLVQPSGCTKPPASNCASS